MPRTYDFCRQGREQFSAELPRKCFYDYHLVVVGLATPIWALPLELLQLPWFNCLPDLEGTHSHLSVSVPGLHGPCCLLDILL